MHPTNTGVQVRIPDGTTMQATHTTQLDIPSLPIAATTAHILPKLSHNLISIGQLCDHGCTATFTQQNLTIKHNTNTILHGQRDTKTGLWTLPSLSTTGSNNNKPQLITHTANNVYDISIKSDLVKYLHRCCFSPTTATWTAAIKHGFLSPY
jgi:hypothetical protein